ncbi:uncharacterized protein LOC134242294 isoform X2 [Saccostrea cucullata]|uniref:uncharacterized protein LOC134242294 isoform X2 n=1 Tax=Saccostrea cuccullata TaxID=36930 RepID=UPI002ED5389A
MINLMTTYDNMETVPPEDIFVDKDAGETGRYYVTLESGDKYLCRYGNASASLLDSPAFSEECYYQNKDELTDIEKNTRLYPYYHSVNLRSPGCGPLPNVSAGTGEWACPKGVSVSSVPVYVSCLFQCFNGATVKIRCTEKLKWNNTLQSGVCSSLALRVENIDSPSKNLHLEIIVPIACLLLIFFTLLIVQRRLYKKCPNLMKRICDSPDTDDALNDTELPVVLGCEIEPGSQKCPETNQIANRTHDVQLQKDASDQNDLNSNTSQDLNRRSDSSSNVPLETMISEASGRYSDCNYSQDTNTSIIQNICRMILNIFHPSHHFQLLMSTPYLQKQTHSEVNSSKRMWHSSSTLQKEPILLNQIPVQR